MHRPEYIKLINKAASMLNIGIEHFSDNWAIKLSKDGVTKYIVGNTFPLNDSSCYKIAGNKNLCSEILTANKIKNVPHKVLINPSILERRKDKKGNFEIIQQFIADNGFPLVLKKNNSSKGEGVYLLNNEPELEKVLTKVYLTDSTLCISPYRKNIREFRNIILGNRCLLCYEKQIPFIIGDDKSLIIELIAEFIKNKNYNYLEPDKFYDNSLNLKLNEIPKLNEKIFLHWKHNRYFGTNYEVVDNSDLKKLALNAAKAINAKFVSVDIIYSEEFGFEVLEINASVSIHFPIFYPNSITKYDKEVEIYQLALQAIFTE